MFDIRHLILLTCLCASCVFGEKPNIVFIMVDDMGYGDPGCYGQEVIKTPNIDALAKRGTRFTDCYAGSPVCAPSRSVLMTGQHTGHTTVRGNFGVGGVKGLGGGEGRVPLRAGDVTVAEVLKQAGYITGMTGKWGLGEPNTTGTPNKQGFDEWLGHLNQRRAHNHYPDYLWLNQDKFPIPENVGGKEGQHSHELFTQFALEFIDTYAGREEPFFLYVPYLMPHAKFQVSSLGPYADQSWTPNEKIYAAMIHRIDLDVGRIVEALEKAGAFEDTILFFCSDNGAANRYEGRFDSSGRLRGGKRDVYEGGIRTPMIVTWPGHVPRDQVDRTPWYFADVLPTLADIVDATAPGGIDGASILPTLLGKGQSELNDRFLYWEFFEGGFKQAARRGKWKVVRAGLSRKIELYDLSNDIGEENDVAEEYPEVVEMFARYLLGARTESPHWPVSPQS